jgi:hypothetical protein
VASSSTTSTVGPAVAEGGEGDIGPLPLEVRYSFLLRVAQEDMLGQRKMKSYE